MTLGGVVGESVCDRAFVLPKSVIAIQISSRKELVISGVSCFRRGGGGTDLLVIYAYYIVNTSVMVQ